MTKYCRLGFKFDMIMDIAYTFNMRKYKLYTQTYQIYLPDLVCYR